MSVTKVEKVGATPAPGTAQDYLTSVQGRGGTVNPSLLERLLTQGVDRGETIQSQMSSGNSQTKSDVDG